VTAPDIRSVPSIPSTTDVLIVGGGPAGALLGCMLARRGIDVLVIEKQAGLDRDFRGETIAPPSVVALRKLGFGPALEEHGYLETSDVRMRMEGHDVFHLDFHRFATGALPLDIPQPALIGMFHEAARDLPGHTYAPSTAFSSLIERDGVIRGAVLKQADGSRTEVRARLVIGADGRFSKVRRESGLTATVQPMQRDSLSFKLPRPADWGNTAQLVVDHDRHLVILPTFPDFLRVGHSLPKRGLGTLRQAGFDAFRDGIRAIDPSLEPLLRTHLTSWDDTGFLEIFTAELDQWTRDGLLLIGDASHTGTPILGQGVNLAIQDVVCVTPVIARALARGRAADSVPATVFDEFVASRRKHKNHVTSYQRVQENALAQGSPFQVRIRRARFRTLNALPIKYQIFARVINPPHPVDPLDLHTAPKAVPTPVS
jgi:2-polyprenyl-6-methoxyphenol hydroxylase-like FAD-dependent oxidoreductase